MAKSPALRADGAVRLSQVQWIGVVGSLAVLLGMFTPLYGMLVYRITLVGLGWPAIVVGVAAVLSAGLIIRGQGTSACCSGLAIMGVLLYLLVRTEISRARIDDQFPPLASGGVTDDPLTNGLATAVVAPQWGWAVLFLGVGAMLFSSVVLIRISRKGPDVG